jgi:transposase
VKISQDAVSRTISAAEVSVHKVDGVEQAIEARGAIPFYLPAYSPDLNPIEQLLAKLKAMLRKIAAYSLKNSAFTIDSLCKAIASCLREISRSECAAFLANSGYGPPNRETLAATSLVLFADQRCIIHGFNFPTT